MNDEVFGAFVHGGNIHDQVEQLPLLPAGCVQGEDGVLRPLEIMMEIMELDLDGRLVARKDDLLDIVLITVFLTVGEEVHGIDDIVFDTHRPEAIKRNVRVLDDVMKDTDLFLEVRLAGKADCHQVEDSGIPDEILLPVVRFQGNAECFFKGHDNCSFILYEGKDNVCMCQCVTQSETYCNYFYIISYPRNKVLD